MPRTWPTLFGSWATTASVGAETLHSSPRCPLTCLADVDWEYPGGNGEDYKRVTNDKKSEIETFPLLLSEIKKAMGPERELSIAVPTRKPDLIAYTPEQVPNINEAVDFVNVSDERHPERAIIVIADRV